VSRKRLGKYEIIERIGRGGMAEVYRGYHAALDRYVAIKLLHPFLADDPEFKDRFENEARNVAKLKHPNIVQVYDFEYDAEGDSYYMVMEMINGPTLKDRLFDLGNVGERFTIPEAIRIIKAAAEALAYAHHRNMIHRDVKPANLMLDEDHRVVLTDFGIAKIVTGAQFTASGGMVGTPAYMAPEQGLGEAGDERSDIYSLGVILFQLVTGRLPYDADTPLAIILKHVNDPLPPPSEFARDIPADLERIICKAMAKEPDDRYQTAAELARELSYLDDYGVRQAIFDTPSRANLDGSRSPWETEPAAPSPADRARLAANSPDQTRRLPEAYPARGIARSASSRLDVTGVLGLLVGIVLVSTLAFIGFGNDDLPLVGLVRPGSTDTPATTTAIAQVAPPTTPVHTSTPEPTEIPARQVTATTPAAETATVTPTPTPTQTATPTLTPSPNLTVTALFHLVETQSAATPTPDMTQTIEACDFEYIVVQPERHNEPPSYNNSSSPRLVRFNSDFTIEIVLRNTGSCAWPKGVRLTYNRALTLNPDDSVNMEPLREACEDDLRPGLNFAAQEQSNFYFTRAVDVTGETDVLEFTGKAPRLYGCYYSVWDLLYPDSSVRIGRPLVLTIRVWGSG